MRAALAGLLAVCCLLARRSHEAALPPGAQGLRENMRLLRGILQSQVSCDEMNVTNIFAEHEGDAEQGTPHAASHALALSSKDAELLCKAATVALEGQSCHVQLQGISLNLWKLLREANAPVQVPCPVAAGNTTSLKSFLQDLNRLHQRLEKNSPI